MQDSQKDKNYSEDADLPKENQQVPSFLIHNDSCLPAWINQEEQKQEGKNSLESKKYSDSLLSQAMQEAKNGSPFSNNTDQRRQAFLSKQQSNLSPNMSKNFKKTLSKFRDRRESRKKKNNKEVTLSSQEFEQICENLPKPQNPLLPDRQELKENQVKIQNDDDLDNGDFLQVGNGNHQQSMAMLEKVKQAQSRKIDSIRQEHNITVEIQEEARQNLIQKQSDIQHRQNTAEQIKALNASASSKLDEAIAKLQFELGNQDVLLNQKLSENSILEQQIAQKNAAFNAQKNQLQNEVMDQENEIAQLRKAIQDKMFISQEYKNSFIQNEQERQNLFEIVEKHRGSMRVYCRVKPLGSQIIAQTNTNSQTSAAALLKSSKLTEQQGCVTVREPPITTLDSQTNQTRPEMPVSVDVKEQNKSQAQQFTFDGVFGCDSTQVEIFEQIKPFVQSALDGDNVCIFAYGQTGAGKTHTMEGPNQDCLFEHQESNAQLKHPHCVQSNQSKQKGGGVLSQIEEVSQEVSIQPQNNLFAKANAISQQGPVIINEHAGILPRTAVFIFEELERRRKYLYGGPDIMRQGQTSEIKIMISSIEIYCGDIVRDVLTGQSIQLVSAPTDGRGNQSSASAVVVLKGQTWREVNSAQQFLDAVKESASKRIFRENGTNAHSSRSHHIFQIQICQPQSPQNYTQQNSSNNCTSLLNIVDLAGSERLTSQTPKPTQSKTQMQKTQKMPLSKSQSQSARQPTIEEEGIMINKSLTTLGRIFQILSSRGGGSSSAANFNPPYRESKLTRILQPSLSPMPIPSYTSNATNSQNNSMQQMNGQAQQMNPGNQRKQNGNESEKKQRQGKTVMIVNVCSSEEHVKQTKASLQFALNAMVAI